MGCTVGRVCNRIGNGTFKLNGKEYHLAKNNGNNHLHGGLKGFSHVSNLFVFNRSCLTIIFEIQKVGHLYMLRATVCLSFFALCILRL